MTKPWLATFRLHSTRNVSVWCFSFVTLFNLQGARLIGGTVTILAHPLAFVKNFFQVFSNFFVLAARGLFGIACLLYQVLPHLSRPFLTFFEVFFGLDCLCQTACIRYHALPNLSTIIFKFLQIFLPAPWDSNLEGSLLYNVSFDSARTFVRRSPAADAGAAPFSGRVPDWMLHREEAHFLQEGKHKIGFTL